MSTTVWKLIGAALLVALVYMFGTQVGYKDGYNTAWDKQQQTINKNTEDSNKKAEAANARITALTEQSLALAQENGNLKVEAAKKQKQDIHNYYNTYPQVANSCGWDEPTVQLINQMLRNQGLLKAAQAQPEGVTK